jgi:hypothetical protein
LEKRAAWFRALKARAKPDIGHGISYKATPWHKFEIQHYRFRMYMKRLLKKFGASAELPYAEAAPPGARRTTQRSSSPSDVQASLGRSPRQSLPAS